MTATSNEDCRSPKSCISLKRENAQKQHAKEVVVEVKEKKFPHFSFELSGPTSPAKAQGRIPSDRALAIVMPNLLPR